MKLGERITAALDRAIERSVPQPVFGMEKYEAIVKANNTPALWEEYKKLELWAIHRLMAAQLRLSLAMQWARLLTVVVLAEAFALALLLYWK